MEHWIVWWEKTDPKNHLVMCNWGTVSVEADTYDHALRNGIKAAARQLGSTAGLRPVRAENQAYPSSK